MGAQGGVGPLPGRRTSFVGRDVERKNLTGLLEAARFVTVVGPPGVGKTRLAIEVAESLTGSFPDIYWIDLSGATDARGFIHALASSFKVPVGRMPDLIERALVRIGQGRVLTVLDNCESLAENVGGFVSELLHRSDGVTVLATSRRPFALEGEVTYRVSRMSLPAEANCSPADLKMSDATLLFTERSGIDVDEITPGEAASVNALCRRMDGLPLAVELAAALASREGVVGMLRALDDRGGVTTPMPVDPDARHASLETALEWSYGSLGKRERWALRQLAAVGQEFTSATAVAVSKDTGTLSTLVDSSLLMIVPSREGPARYKLLGAIQEFALARTSPNERDEAFDRLLSHLANVAAVAEEGFRTQSMVDWLEMLAADHDNLMSAIAWAIGAEKRSEAGDLIARLLWYWLARGKAPEVRGQLEELCRYQGVDPSTLMRWHWAAGRLAQYEWDRDNAHAHALEALAIARSTGDEAMAAKALVGIGWMRLAQSGDRTSSKRDFEEAVSAAERSSDQAAMAYALQGLATISMSIGEWPDALKLVHGSVAAARKGNVYEVLVDDLIWLSYLSLNIGDDQAAATALHEAVGLAERLNDPFHASSYRSLLGALKTRQGKVEEARTHLEEADRLARIAAAPFPRMLCDTYLALLEYWEGSLSAAGVLESSASQSARSIVHLAGTLLSHSAELALARGESAEAERLIGRARDWRSTAGGPDAALAIAEASAGLNSGDTDGAELKCHVAISDARSVGAEPYILESLELLAAVIARKGSPNIAARLLGCTDNRRSQKGWPRSWLAAGRHAATSEAVAQDLGKDAAEASMKEGAALSLEDAVSYVRRGRGLRDRPVAGWASLTPVEMDVVRLVRQGLGNPQIAHQLFISRATVKTHLVHVYAKLGLSLRSELIVEAIRHLDN